MDTIPEKDQISSNVQVESATLNFILKDKFEKTSKRTISQIRDEVTKRATNVVGATIELTDASLSTTSSSTTGGSGMGSGGGSSNMMRLLGVGTNQERILIKGQDFDLMKNVASDLQYYLESLESMNRVRISVTDNRPEVHLRFHPLVLSEYNVSLANVSGELNSSAKRSIRISSLNKELRSMIF